MTDQDTDLPDLSPRQREYLAHLPASTPDVAERMDVAETTIEDFRNALAEKGVDLEYDRAANQWYIADERAPKLRRISTKHKTSKTREANTLIEEEERRLLRRLDRTDPLRTPPTSDPSAESFNAVLSDLHAGDLVEADDGTVLYDMDTFRESVQTFGQKCLKIRQLQSELTQFDDAYLWLLGDIATGEGIYEGQVYDIEAYLADQVTSSVEALYELAVTLADAFDTLQIRCVLGNHGRTRASGVSGQANTDLLTYRWLDDALRRDDVENVDLRVAEATHHMDAEMRDWTVHARHGQDWQKHVDKTARSEADWRGWREAHRYDIGLRGHWHNPSFDKVLNQFPVFTTPSPKPGGEFIERMGSPDVSDHRDLGWVFGSSDTRPVTWRYLIDDR